MYRERPSRIDGAVVWESRVGQTPYRVLPDGCMDLLWVNGRLLVAGPDARAYLESAPPGTRYVGLRFAPGAGPAVVGVPAHELKGLRVPLDALWPGPVVRRRGEQVAEAGDAGRGLEALVMDGSAGTGSPDPWAVELVALLQAGHRVAAVAGAAAMSERQLRRRCQTAFGYGPKALARILRLQRALLLAREGAALATVAAVAGYADQAHLARDVRALAGTSPAELIGPG